MNKEEETIKKIIKIAKESGLNTKWYSDGFLMIDEEYGNIINYNDGLYKILFSNNFAKTLWGEEEICRMCGDEKCSGNCEPLDSSWMMIPKWKYFQHEMLNEMQKEKEPLKYLEKFL